MPSRSLAAPTAMGRAFTGAIGTICTPRNGPGSQSPSTRTRCPISGPQTNRRPIGVRARKQGDIAMEYAPLYQTPLPTSRRRSRKRLVGLLAGLLAVILVGAALGRGFAVPSRATSTEPGATTADPDLRDRLITEIRARIFGTPPVTEPAAVAESESTALATPSDSAADADEPAPANIVSRVAAATRDVRDRLATLPSAVIAAPRAWISAVQSAAPWMASTPTDGAAGRAIGGAAGTSAADCLSSDP